jgi:integrase
MASVQQHKSRWRVKWHVDGRAVYESFATKTEAEAAARKVEAHAVLDGRAPDVLDPNALTLAKWWARWEPGRAWRPSSRATLNTWWRRYVEPVFGHMPLDQIATADVLRLHRRLEARGLSPATVSAVHRTLSMVLQGAVDDGLLARNPARYARLRKVPESRPVALDAKTTAALLDAVAATTPELAMYARLVAATGMRRSEAAGVTWDRVDLEAGLIVVDRQLDYTAATLPAWCPTKNAKSRRVLLTSTTVAELRAHRVATPVASIDGLLFTRPDGRPWRRAQLQDAWTRAAKVLAETDTPLPTGARGWHTLRHTVASRLLEAGVPPADIASMLGHTVDQLLSTYSHITDRSAADERLRAALDG